MRQLLIFLALAFSMNAALSSTPQGSSSQPTAAAAAAPTKAVKPRRPLDKEAPPAGPVLWWLAKVAVLVSAFVFVYRRFTGWVMAGLEHEARRVETMRPLFAVPYGFVLVVAWFAYLLINTVWRVFMVVVGCVWKALLTCFGIFALMNLGGCASAPEKPVLPDGSARVALNSPATQELLVARAQVAALRREVRQLKASRPSEGVLLAALGPLPGAMPDMGMRGTRRTAMSCLKDNDLAGGLDMQVYDIRVQDGVFAATLARWGRGEGLDVAWDSEIQAEITGPGQVVAPDFRTALQKSMASLQSLGYPLRARVYTDGVVRIVPTEETPR